MVKLGEQAGIERLEMRTVGKLGRQVGARPTRAEIIKKERTKEEKRKIREIKEKQRKQKVLKKDLKKELRQAEQRRKQLKKAIGDAFGKGAIGRANRLTRKDKGLMKKQKAIKEVLRKLEKGYVDRQQARKYIEQQKEFAIEREKRKTSIEQEREAIKKSVKQLKTGKIKYEDLPKWQREKIDIEKTGKPKPYTKAEKEKIEAWMKKYQMTPTPQKIQEIIRKEKVEVSPKQEIYGILGLKTYDFTTPTGFEKYAEEQVKIKREAEKKIKIEEPKLKKGEYYDPISGMIVSETPTGMSGTLSMRPPTPKERVKFGEEEKNILFARLSKLRDVSEQYSTERKEAIKSSEELKKFDKYIKNGEFIGSKEQYEKYLKAYSKYGKELSEFESAEKRAKSYTAGLGQLTLPADLSKEKFRRGKPDIYFGVFTETLGGYVGATSKELVKTVGGTEEKPFEFGTTQTISLLPYQLRGTITPEIEKAIIEQTEKPVISITPTETAEFGKIIGETSPYLIPHYFATSIGTKLTGSVFREESFLKGGISYAKAYPYEAIAGATFGGAKVFGKTRRLLFAPTAVKRGENIFLTTRAQEIFGKRIRIPLRKGEEFAITKARPYFRVVEKEVGAAGLVESQQPYLFRTISLADEPTYKLGKKYFMPLKDIKSAQRIVIPGKKKIIYETVPKKFRFSFKKGIEYLPEGEKKIFAGLSPYTKTGKIEREFTLKRFEKVLGISERAGKDILKKRFPKVIEYKGDITGVFIESEFGQKLTLREKGITTFPQYKFIDEFGVTTPLKRKPIETKTVADIFPTGETTKAGERIFKTETFVYTPSKQLGKRTESFIGFEAAKKLGEKELPYGAEKIGEIGTAKLGRFEFYKSAEITQRFIPKKLATEETFADVIIKKPIKRKIIDLNEIFGISDESATFVTTSGKKSSKEYFQSLYTQQEDILGTGLTSLKKTKRFTEPPARKTTISTITEQTQEYPLVTETKISPTTKAFGRLKTEEKEISISAPKVKERAKEKEEVSQVDALGQRESLKQMGALDVKSLQITAQVIRQAQRQKQMQREMQRLKIKMPKTPKVPTIPFIPRTPKKPKRPQTPPLKMPFPFLIPKPSRPKREKRTKGKAPRQRIIRKPSLVAIGRQIYAPTVAKGEVSGLVIRPIIRKKKKKKSIFEFKPSIKI